MNRSNSFVLALLAATAISGTTAFAETPGAEDQAAEAQTFLASPTGLAQAIATAETAAGGKVAAIEYETGRDGTPDLIMAKVILADGSEKVVAINPADGKAMKVAQETEEEGGGKGGHKGEGKGGNEGGERGGDDSGGDGSGGEGGEGDGN